MEGTPGPGMERHETRAPPRGAVPLFPPPPPHKTEVAFFESSYGTWVWWGRKEEQEAAWEAKTSKTTLGSNATAGNF
jgi:hypothetical protein